MEAFQNLISSGKINIDYLTTHEFEFDNAKAAFDLVVSKTEPFRGIALKYNIEKAANKDKIFTGKIEQLEKLIYHSLVQEVMHRGIYYQIFQ